MEARDAIYRYCSYQERSHKEVRNKLYELKCTTPEVEEMIAELIEKDLLNEERYARAIARGKFHMKHWGRQKIIYQLKQNQVSEYCIKKALTEIDEEEYYQTIVRLIEKKQDSYKGVGQKDYMVKSKLLKYLVQKGYEYGIAKDAINETFNN